MRFRRKKPPPELPPERRFIADLVQPQSPRTLAEQTLRVMSEIPAERMPLTFLLEMCPNCGRHYRLMHAVEMALPQVPELAGAVIRGEIPAPPQHIDALAVLSPAYIGLRDDPDNELPPGDWPGDEAGLLLNLVDAQGGSFIAAYLPSQDRLGLIGGHLEGMEREQNGPLIQSLNALNEAVQP